MDFCLFIIYLYVGGCFSMYVSLYVRLCLYDCLNVCLFAYLFVPVEQTDHYLESN